MGDRQALYAVSALLPILAEAARMDYLEQRVEKKLLYYGFFAGFLYRLAAGHLFPWWQSFLGLFLPIVFLFPLYLAHVLGAGDLKLFSMIGCFLGFPLTEELVFYSFLFGAAAALAHAVWHGRKREKGQEFEGRQKSAGVEKPAGKQEERILQRDGRMRGLHRGDARHSRQNWRRQSFVPEIFAAAVLFAACRFFRIIG